jgi:hypothetical protein
MEGQSSAEAWFVASFAANPKQLDVPHLPQFDLGSSLYISTAVFILPTVTLFRAGVKCNSTDGKRPEPANKLFSLILAIDNGSERLIEFFYAE